VKFIRGGHYTYADVPLEKHAELMAAESKGKFIGKEIRGNYVFTKWEDGQPTTYTGKW